MCMFVCVCVPHLNSNMCFWPWTVSLGSYRHLIFHSKFMDLFKLVSDPPISSCVFVSLSCSVCVCQCVFFFHGCHIIYMDEWPSQGHVTLSKTLCAVTGHSFQPSPPSFRLASISCFLTMEFQESQQLCVTRRSLTNSHDSEVQPWVWSINRLCLLCDVMY